jgi:hypothetical protein
MTTDRLLELLHIAYISIDGSKYCLVIVDGYSRFTWVFFFAGKILDPRDLKKILKMGSK